MRSWLLLVASSFCLFQAHAQSRLAFMHGADDNSGAGTGLSMWVSNGDGTFKQCKISDIGFDRDNVASEVFGDDGSSATFYVDVTGDGIVDIVHASEYSSTNGIYVYKGNGRGSFSKTVIATTGMQAGTDGYVFAGQSGGESSFMADVDGDGKLDYATSGNDNKIHVYKGNGDGTFVKTRITTALTGANGYASSGTGGGEATFLMDVNGDGKADLVATNEGDGRSVRTWLATTAGNFNTVPVTTINCQQTGSSQFTGVAGNETSGMADVNGDGKLDFVHVNEFDSNIDFFVFLGDGLGGFATTYVRSVVNNPAGTNFQVIGDYNSEYGQWIDVTGDGKVDFVTSADNLGANSGIYVYKGNGDGTFQAAPIVTLLPCTTFQSGNDFTETTRIAQVFSAGTTFANNCRITPTGTTTAPGGVADMLLWLKADDLTQNTEGSKLATWGDSLSWGSLTNTNINYHPTLNKTTASKLINFNPSVSFDGTDELRTDHRLYCSSSPFQLVTLALDERTNRAELRAPMGIGGDGNYPAMDLQTDGVSLNGWNPWMTGSSPAEYGTGTQLLFNGNTGGANRQPQIMSLGSANASTSAADNIIGWVDGFKEATTLDAKQQAEIGNSMFLGSSGDAQWLGRIPEAMIFTRQLTDVEMQKVNSYLAIKYGITLRQSGAGMDYLASDGTVLWSVTANTTYKNDITVVGRDDVSGLYQKQSKSVNIGVQPTLSLTAIAATNQANTGTLTNKNFEAIAHNGLVATTYGTTYAPASFSPIAPFYLMPRIWKVQETGTVGTVTIGIPLSTGAERLLVSTTAAFVPASTQEILLTNDGNGNLTATVDFVDGQFFTFGKVVTAPGCVAANLKLWLKADAGTTLSGGKVANWASEGADIAVSQANAAKQPTWVANALNFNPALDYTGGQVLTNLNQASSVFPNTTDPATLYGVSTNRNATAWWKALVNFDGNDDYPSPNLNWFGQQSDGYSWGLTTPDSRHTTVIPLNTPTMMFSRFANASPGAVRVSYNGLTNQQTFNNADNSYPAGQNEFAVGAETDGLREPHDGLLPEIIVYNRELTDPEVKRVNTYLGIKYGIHVTDDYLSGAGTTIWDKTANTAYHNNVFGIGRDDCQALNQKQSKSVNTTAFVTVSNGTTVAATNAANTSVFTADKSFEIIGDNNLALDYTTAYTPSFAANGLFFYTMPRVWKVQETGTVGQVTIRIPGTAQNTYLLVKNSATFGSGATEYLMAKDGNGNLIVTVDLANGDYFTFTTPRVAPGAVPTALSRWYKADYNASSTAWNDASPNLKNTTSANGSITFNNTGANFNPFINFNSGYFFAPAAYQGINTDNTKVFTVNIPKSASNNTSWGQQSTSGYNIAAYNPHSDGQIYFDAPWSYRTNTNFATAGGVLGVPMLIRDSKILGSNYIHMAGKQISTAGTGTFIGNYPGSAQAFHIGAQNGATSNNDLAELVIYENASAMTAAQVQQIESYLAIKYGITLDQTLPTNYVNSANAVIWDGIANIGYKKDVTAIGRDDAEGLDQEQSMSVNASAVVTIGLGTIAETNIANANNFTADKSYEIISDNGLGATFGTTITGPSGVRINNRFTRIWKVQETGTVGSVKIGFPADLGQGATVYLVRSTNATFDATDEFIPLSILTVGTASYLAANIDFNNGDFFTVATYMAAPGGVAANLAAWYRANGVVGTTQWNDDSGNDKHMLAAGDGTAARMPTVEAAPGAVNNFNPRVAFLSNADGNRKWTMTGTGNDIFPTTTTPGTIFNISNFPSETVYDVPQMYAFEDDDPGINLFTDRNADDDIRVVFQRDNGGTGVAGWDFIVPDVSQTVPLLTAHAWNYAAGGNTLSFNGYDYTPSAGTNVGPTSPRYIFGAELTNGGGEAHSGYTSENIVYSTNWANNSNERKRINSYLAIKYGITLLGTGTLAGGNANATFGGQADYLSSASTVIWNGTTTNSAYHNNIAAIGRDDASALHQKQSTSANKGIQPIIGLTDIAATNAANTASLTEGAFMFWGSDAGAAVFGTPIVSPSGISANNRFTRIWKVQETGTVGTVKVAFAKGLNQDAAVYLIRSTDATFDATDEFIPLSNLTVGGNDYVAADINFNNGDFFTIATYVVGPGGVVGVDFWVKSNDAGTIATAWKDHSNNANPIEAVGAWSLSAADAAHNFNPYTTGFSSTKYFRDANSSLTADNTYGVQTRTEFSVFSAVKANGANGRITGIDNDDFFAAEPGFSVYQNKPYFYKYWETAGGDQHTSLITNGQSSVLSFNATQLAANSSNMRIGKDGTYQDFPRTGYFHNLGQYHFVGYGTWDLNGAFPGDIMEVAWYKRNLTSNEQDRVNTYLGLKNGVSLSINYLASNSDIIWNRTTNSAYSNDITGIGRDDASALNQKQSVNAAQGVRPTIGLGTLAASNEANSNAFAADKTFEIWGSNGLSAGYGTVYTPTTFTPTFPFKRMNRAWKVQEVQTVGPVAVKINSNADYMLVDTDGDGNFATGTITEIALTNGQATYDFANGDVFSFGREVVVQTCNNGLAFVHGDDASYNGTFGTVAAGITAWRSNGDGTFNTTKVTQSGGFRATQTGTFGSDIYSATYTADVDNDGDKDLIHVTEDNSNTIYVYLNNGDATFQTTPIVTTAIQGGTNNGFTGQSGGEQGWMGDANSDGNVDYIFSGDDKQIHVYLGTGDGRFATTRISTTLTANGYNTSGISGAELFLVADVNNDGSVDLVGTYDPGILRVWLGNGDGTFQPNPYFDATIQDSGGSNSSGSADDEYSQFADVDGDGDLDYVHAEGFDSSPQIWAFLNNGDGTFATTAVLTQPTTMPGTGLTDFANYNVGTQSFFADVNNDGKADYIATVDNNTIASQNGIFVYLATSGGSYAIAPIATPIPSGFATGSNNATEISFIACGFILCNAGNNAPSVSATKTNICPATTANLSTIVPNNSPSGVVTTWHTATPATLSNRVPDSTSVGAGTYYAAFLDKINGCLSPTSTGVTVTITSPCPATFTFNCASATSTGTFAANATAGQTGTLQISLTSATAGPATFNVAGTGFTGTLTTTLTAAQASVTIPITYDGTGVARTQVLTVTSTGGTGTCTPSVTIGSGAPVCTAGTAVPNLATTTLTNACPRTTANLASIVVGNKPNGAVMTWHSATPATVGNRVPDSTAVTAGTYFAVFYDGSLGCYGGTPTGSLTTSVVVTMEDCPANITVGNVCPTNTVNLTTRINGTVPAGKVVTWHTALPTTTANKVANPAAVGNGTYYAAFYDSANDCYSPGSPNGIVVAITLCQTPRTGPTAPALSATTLGNVCPATTANLATITASNLPVGTNMSWHSSATPDNTNIITSVNSVPAGTYYAAFFDDLANSYSPATAVTVTIATCATCEAGYTKPTLSASTANNTCPTTTANLGTITASYLPVGATLSWHTATPATLANKVVDSSIIATSGTYYATYYDKTNGCFTGGGDSTVAVVVTIASCSTPDLRTYIGQPTPTLVVGQQSNMPVSVKNIGGQSATGPITTTITLPTGVSTLPTFMTNGSTCNTTGQTVTCTNPGPIAANDSILMNIPITPDASIVGTNPVFNASVGTVSGEINTANNTATPMTSGSQVAAATIKVSAKAFLSGSYVSATGLMTDLLRSKNLIPPAQPYTSMGYTGTETVAPSVLAVTGANAIVDWVLVELRSDTSTTTTRRAALIQRDGDIVDTDGTSPLSLTATAGNYYVVVRHRNHLGVMTANKLAISATTTTVDFTATTTANWQKGGAFGNANAQRTFGSVRALWGGNASGNNNVKSTGAGSDGEAVLFKVLLDSGNSVSLSPSYIIYDKYNREDANMDGNTIYQGTGSELDAILLNVLLHPTNSGVVTTYVIYEQLP